MRERFPTDIEVARRASAYGHAHELIVFVVNALDSFLNDRDCGSHEPGTSLSMAVITIDPLFASRTLQNISGTLPEPGTGICSGLHD
jgi:hypothetical protein